MASDGVRKQACGCVPNKIITSVAIVTKDGLQSKCFLFSCRSVAFLNIETNEMVNLVKSSSGLLWPAASDWIEEWNDGKSRGKTAWSIVSVGFSSLERKKNHLVCLSQKDPKFSMATFSVGWSVRCVADLVLRSVVARSQSFLHPLVV